MSRPYGPEVPPSAAVVDWVAEDRALRRRHLRAAMRTLAACLALALFGAPQVERMWVRFGGPAQLDVHFLAVEDGKGNERIVAGSRLKDDIAILQFSPDHGPALFLLTDPEQENAGAMVGPEFALDAGSKDGRRRVEIMMGALGTAGLRIAEAHESNWPVALVFAGDSVGPGKSAPRASVLRVNPDGTSLRFGPDDAPLVRLIAGSDGPSLMLREHAGADASDSMKDAPCESRSLPNEPAP